MDCFHQGIQETVAAQLVLIMVYSVHLIDVLQLLYRDVASGNIGLAQVLDPIIEAGPLSHHKDTHQPFQVLDLLSSGGTAVVTDGLCPVLPSGFAVQSPLDEGEQATHQSRAGTAAQDRQKNFHRSHPQQAGPGSLAANAVWLQIILALIILQSLFCVTA